MPSLPVQGATYVQGQSVQPAARCATPQVVNRRKAFAVVAGWNRNSVLPGLVALSAPKADAIVLPSQESTGSTVKRGSLPPNASEASSSGYGMEGPKKMGISAKKRQELLAQARADAGKN